MKKKLIMNGYFVFQFITWMNFEWKRTFFCTGDLTFKRGEHLRTHIVNHHPDVPCPPVKGRLAYKSKGAASSSKVPCRVATCHKKYSSSNNMYHHMRTAHPEVPLKMQRNAKGSQEAKDANIKSELNRVKVKKACPICRKLYNSNILNTHIM